MKEEINAGVKFLRDFLARYGQLTQLQIEQFASKLTRLLLSRYANHWYEAAPLKGQAYRCLRLRRSENYIDPVLEQILRECGLSLSQLGLTNDFTLWIDPGEVSVRFGDQIGYTYTIAKFETAAASATVSASPPVVDTETMFDEKLTAFIRQNSTITTTAVTAAAAAQPDDTDDSVADAIASLSVSADTGRPLNSSTNISIAQPHIMSMLNANEPELG